MDILLDPILLSLVLLGIHAYFGREIIHRGIIFTDIALGQFAALGLAIALLLNLENFSYEFAVAATLGGALLIYLAEFQKRFQEAFIGLAYAFAAALAFLLLSKSAQGAEHFLSLTAADILFVPRQDIIHTAIFYAVIAILIYFRERYLRNRWRELGFYLLFALTVSSSVKLAGVFVIFAILLAPALVSHLLRRGLIFAWIYGAAINVAGIVASYYWDLPTGFTLVFFQSAAALIVFLILAFARRSAGEKR